MPMTGAGMKAAIKPVIKTKFQAAFDIQDADILDDFADALADALGTAIVSYIQGNAQVAAGITVQVAPASGTGATTGTGSIL